MTSYHLVILLRLRDQDVHTATSLTEFFYHDDAHSIASEIESTEGKGVLFILEGLNELPTSCREDKNSIFIKLITGRLLSRSTVLVTT